MGPFRRCLVWLLCALLVGAGVPLRAGQPCPGGGATADGAPCCSSGQCHCGEPAAGDCCSEREQRQPEAPPAPVLGDQAALPELLPVTTLAAARPVDFPRPAMPPRSGALAPRSTQAVLSVWRL